MRAESNPRPEDREAAGDLLAAPPLPAGRAPLWHRILRRPWPLVDVLLLKSRTCHLCEIAEALLLSARGRLGIRLRTRDITGDPDLVARHGEEIPVVFVAGTKRFRGKVDPALLSREVAAAREASGIRSAGRI